MKKISASVLYLLLFANFLQAQNVFPATGRTGINTTTPAASLQVRGGARIGNIANYTNIDSATGNLSFGGTSVYQVAGNKYAFQLSSSPNYGLFFNSSLGQYEFRDGAALPVFSVQGTGTAILKGSLKIGAYTLPATDGLNGQILKTNGIGVLTWSADNNTTYISGTGISIAGNTITNTAPDKTVVLTAGSNISVTGTYPNFTIANTAAAGWALGGNSGTNPSTQFIGTTDAKSLAFKVNNVRAGFVEADELKGTTAFGEYTLLSNTGNQNTAIGFKSLYSNSTGFNNVSVGSSALLNNTTGNDNTALGFQSLNSNSTGSFNTAHGSLALSFNTTGTGNTAMGYASFFNNTTGSNNTANGNLSLYSNTSGYSNVAVGVKALYSNTVGHNLVAVGDSALYNQGYDILGYYGNTAIGSKALFANTTGNANTSVGAFALSSNTTGYSNTSTGYNSLLSNTTGYGNTANGISALYSNTTGNSNSAFGIGALGSTTTGNSNTAAGANALSLNTTGYSNVAIGVKALNKNTDRSNLVAVGDSALYNNGIGAIGLFQAKYNTAIGSKVLYSNTTGYFNTAIGYNSLLSNTTGYSNTAMGFSALALNTAGYGNTAIGVNSLYGLHSAIFNTAMGYESQYNALDGSNNTSIGTHSLYENTNGDHNAAFGYESLYNNKTGNYNTANGSGAGSYNDNNSYCTFIGYEADQTINIDFTNSMTLGSLSTITASNQVRIGNSSITSIGGQVGWSTLSDGRYKKQVKENVPGLEFIRKLKPVTYHLDVTGVANKLNENRNDDATSDKNNDSKALIEKGRADKEKILYTGFIAQDVEKSAKEIGYDFSGVDAPKNDDDLYSLRYDAFVVPLVKAVQELSTENDALKTRLEKVETLLAQLTSKPVTDAGINHTQVTLSSARLEQNIPNPFSNRSTINYYLPDKITQAVLKITGTKGEIVKTISLNTKGNGSISFSNEGFAAGVYYYSLIADGKLIETKKMVITN